ncbi:DUF3102 domain-containing protein [Paenibacillus sp. EKM208P]|nr:DUF3102 domain-containing protein [Paenibacillus sp. EKM208P]
MSQEIIHYKKIEANATLEIGKRLKHVKENDLVHGEWEKWLNSVDVIPQTARKMIQAYEQFSSSAMSRDLTSSKMFEMLSLPESIDREEFITQGHIVPSTGQQKTVKEMTVRELREVTKAAKNSTQEKSNARDNVSDTLHKESEKTCEPNSENVDQVIDEAKDKTTPLEYDPWIIEVANGLQNAIPAIKELYDNNKISLISLYHIGELQQHQQIIVAKAFLKINSIMFSIQILNAVIYLAKNDIREDFIYRAIESIEKITESDLFSDIYSLSTLKDFVEKSKQMTDVLEVTSFFMELHFAHQAEKEKEFNEFSSKYSQYSDFNPKNIYSNPKTMEQSFKILGVKNNDKNEAKDNFKKLTRLFHPDTAKQYGLGNGYETLFQIIKEAYDLIRQDK